MVVRGSRGYIDSEEAETVVFEVQLQRFKVAVHAKAPEEPWNPKKRL